MQSLVLLSIIPFIVLSIFFAWYNSAKQKGKRGEKRVFSVLSQLPDEYTVLNDLVLRTEKGTTQIDHVVVSKYGVFAIETKNYRGEIYGDDNRKEWTQMIITDVTYSSKCWKTYTYVTKNHFYNPVKQSLAHCYALKNILSRWSALKIVPKAHEDYKIASGICPKCGGKLVLRKGKYGRFYGCSNYPRCRFTA